MPRYTQARKTRFYPVNFKIKAVELSLRDDVVDEKIPILNVDNKGWRHQKFILKLSSALLF